MQYMPLGGIFYYDLYHLPPQALVVHGWEIRQVNGKGFSSALICCRQVTLQGSWQRSICRGRVSHRALLTHVSADAGQSPAGVHLPF